MPSDKPLEFHEIVYEIVITERRGTARQLATALGLTYGAFHNRLTGRAEFTPRQINILLQQLNDVRLADYLFAGTAFHAVETSKSSEIDDIEVLISSLMFVVDTLRKGRRPENLVVTDDSMVVHVDKNRG
jgi:hypothetical protein